MNAMDRLHEDWWQNYLQSLTPAERAAEIAQRGAIWRHLQARLFEAMNKELDHG